MPINRKKTPSNAHRFWNLGNLRRQRARKLARGSVKRSNDLTNLQLSGSSLDTMSIPNDKVGAHAIKQSNEG